MAAQDLSALEIMEKVLNTQKPNSSISDIKLEIVRVKRGKEKIKVREFTSFKKNYQEGKFKSKSLARFKNPITVKGTGLLSWVYRNGKTEQWFFLPKLKTAKRVKAKEKAKSFMGTDFIYEDLESRKTGQDSLVLLSTEYLNGKSVFDPETSEKISGAMRFDPETGEAIVEMQFDPETGEQCQVILAFPKNESAYHSRKIWINSLNWRILKIEYYSQKSIKQKTLTISEFIEKNGFVIPTKMVMKKSNGNKTIMEIKNFKPNVGLKDEIFSESFLIKF